MAQNKILENKEVRLFVEGLCYGNSKELVIHPNSFDTNTVAFIGLFSKWIPKRTFAQLPHANPPDRDDS